MELTFVIKQPFQLESEREEVMAIWNLFIGLLLATQFESFQLETYHYEVFQSMIAVAFQNIFYLKI